MYDLSVCWMLLSIILCNSAPFAPASPRFVEQESGVIDLRVPEHAAPGEILGTVLADPSGFHDFRIVEDGANGLFVIDPVSSQLSVSDSRALPGVKADAFTLQIEGTLSRTDDSGLQEDFAASLLDSGISAEELAQLLRPKKLFHVRIRLIDVPEPPLITEQHFSVAENSLPGSVVGTVFALDPDATDFLTFTLTTGNDPPLFQLDALTGVLSISDTATLDYNLVPRHQLGVRVTDSAGFTSETTIVVEVVDVVVDVVEVVDVVDVVDSVVPEVNEPELEPESGAVLPEVAVSPPVEELEISSALTPDQPEQVEAVSRAWPDTVSLIQLAWICGIAFAVGLILGSIVSVVWMRSRTSTAVDSKESSELASKPLETVSEDQPDEGNLPCLNGQGDLSECEPEHGVSDEQLLLIQVQQLQRQLQVRDDIAHKSLSLGQLAQDQATLIELLQQELQDCREELERVAAASEVDGQSTKMIQLLKSEVEQRNLLITSLRDQLDTLVTAGPVPVVSDVCDSTQTMTAAVQLASVASSGTDTATPFNAEVDLRAELAELFDLQKRSLQSGAAAVENQQTTGLQRDPSDSRSNGGAAENRLHDPTAAQPELDTDYDEYIRRYMSNLLNKKDYEPPVAVDVKAPAPLKIASGAEIDEDRRVADRRGNADRRDSDGPGNTASVRPRFDPEALRDKTNSFRQIALQSVEQALASHVKRKARLGLITRMVLLAALLIGTILVVSANALSAIQLPPLNWLMGLLVVLSTAELIIRIRAVKAHSKLPPTPRKDNQLDSATPG